MFSRIIISFLVLIILLPLSVTGKNVPQTAGEVQPSSGLIVTNANVVDDAQEATI